MINGFNGLKELKEAGHRKRHISGVERLIEGLNKGGKVSNWLESPYVA